MEPRRLDFEERRRRKKPFPADLLLSREERLRRKPRDPDEAAALANIVRAKLELYHKSGKIEFIGPRQRRYHIGREKIIEYLRKQKQL